MTRDKAVEEATLIAEQENIVMSVTFNPYGEEEDRCGWYSYHPQVADHIFSHERVVKIVKPTS